MKSKNRQILFCTKPLNIADGIEFAKSPKCGAISTFSGTIRDTDFKSSKTISHQLEPILGIYYETYQAMATEQIEEIVNDLITKQSDLVDPNSRVYIGIRLGFVPAGETSLIICVSSTSRGFAHDATMTILEKIKSTVVIWKKISFENGDVEWADTSKSNAYWLK